MPTYLGLDCGGTKTLAMVCDESGKVLHEKRSGPANFASTPRDLVRKHITEAVDGAPQITAACVCMAGILTEQDSKDAAEIVKDVTGAELVEARPDTHASWAATEGEADLLVIAGTGAIVCSEQDGVFHKSGGGGPIFGDEGSAASVGRRSLYCTIVSAEQLTASDEYWEAVVEQFGARDPQEVIAGVYGSESPAAKFANLAGPVGIDAANGMEYATLSVGVTMNLLAEEVDAHLERYLPALEEIRICLAGGLWKTHPIYQDQFTDALYGRHTVCRKLERPPVYGAVQLARRLKR